MITRGVQLSFQGCLVRRRVDHTKPGCYRHTRLPGRNPLRIRTHAPFFLSHDLQRHPCFPCCTLVANPWMLESYSASRQAPLLHCTHKKKLHKLHGGNKFSHKETGNSDNHIIPAMWNAPFYEHNKPSKYPSWNRLEKYPSLLRAGFSDRRNLLASKLCTMFFKGWETQLAWLFFMAMW